MTLAWTIVFKLFVPRFSFRTGVSLNYSPDYFTKSKRKKKPNKRQLRRLKWPTLKVFFFRGFGLRPKRCLRPRPVRTVLTLPRTKTSRSGDENFGASSPVNRVSGSPLCERKTKRLSRRQVRTQIVESKKVEVLKWNMYISGGSRGGGPGVRPPAYFWRLEGPEKKIFKTAPSLSQGLDDRPHGIEMNKSAKKKTNKKPE